MPSGNLSILFRKLQETQEVQLLLKPIDECKLL